jgi:uncharacterized protein
MKRLVFLALSGLLCLSLSAPGIVSDEADLLSPQSKQVLESIILQWTQATQHQMGIVTLKSLNESSIEEVAVKRFESMGIGRKGINDGLLFIIAPNDRKMRIEVGYGLEGTLPDGLVGEIRDRYVVPFFKTGKFEDGVLAGTLALLTTQAKNEGIAFSPSLDKPIPQPPIPQSNRTDWGGLIFIIIMVIIVISSKGGRSGGFLPLLILSSLMGGGGRYDDRGGFGGFGGGGFGGFGGGMSGGGGASGGW